MTVDRLFTRESCGGAQTQHTGIRVIAGAGIEGDRYFDQHDEPGQNVTLVEAEEIEAFFKEQGRPLDLSATGRNIVTRGVRLNELVGREFFVGAVRLRGVKRCQPCLHFAQSLQFGDVTPAQILRRWVHRAGLRADAMDNGRIVLGDRIVPV